jgi:hypothetical protein
MLDQDLVHSIVGNKDSHRGWTEWTVGRNLTRGHDSLLLVQQPVILSEVDREAINAVEGPAVASAVASLRRW